MGLGGCVDYGMSVLVVFVINWQVQEKVYMRKARWACKLEDVDKRQHV